MCTVLTEGGAVALGRVAVLKFGSSLLSGAEGFRAVVDEVGRELGSGGRVLAVVSATRGTTDRLIDAVTELTEAPAGALLSRLLRTGEDASAALLGIALTSSGVNAHVLAADELGLRTSGPLHDGSPVEVDLARLATCLRAHDVVVVPGFVGTDTTGSPSLLGRGGSDLTALFLAARLGAEEVRLVKDVDGVYTTDPRGPGAAGDPLPNATWSEVATLGGGVVQEKALRFAEAHGMSFRVAAPRGRGTLVGAGEVR